MAARAEAARELVGAPAAAAADGRERVGRDEKPHDRSASRSHRRRRTSASQCACPTVLANGALAGGRAEPSRTRAPDRSARASASASAAGPRGIVEQPFASVRQQRWNAIDGRRDDRQARGHVLEDLQRRPVEPERQRRDARRRRKARRRYPPRRGTRACGREARRRSRARSSRSAGSSCTAWSSGPSPTNTAPTSRSSAVRGSSRMASHEVDRAVPAPKRSCEDRDRGRGPFERRGRRGVRAEPIGVGAPLEPTTFEAGVRGGRIATLGVTMRSARAQMRSRHRRIGSTMSTRSTSVLRRSGMVDHRRIDLEHAFARRRRPRGFPRRRSCSSAR